MGASTLYVAVGQELAGFGVKKLLRFFFYQKSFLVQYFEEIGGSLVVGSIGGTGVDVETDAEILKRLLDKFVVFVHYFLYADALFLGTNGNGHAVFVGAAYQKYIGFAQAKVACIYVCRNIHSCQVAYVDRAIGVGQGGSKHIAFGLCHENLRRMLLNE